MKIVKKLVVMVMVLALSCGCFVVPCSAATVKADPEQLLAVCSEETGVPADLDSMVNAGILTSGEKKMIEQNGVFTSAVAWRILFPVFGVYPYPASCYPEIKPADQVVGDYANARCAAITLGLATEKQNPIVVMTANQFNTLVKALKKGVELPKIDTGISYVESVGSWDLNSYKGRNSMIDAYASIPGAWLADFDAQGWTFKYELPQAVDPAKVLVGHYAAGSTNYQEKVIRIGAAEGKVTVHEMVHYIVKRANISKDQMNAIFNAEKAAMKDILGVYSQTQGSEYIPEFIAYWILNPIQHDALKAAAPLSAAMAETLVAWTAA